MSQRLVFRSKAGPLSSAGLSPGWSAIERQLSANVAVAQTSLSFGPSLKPHQGTKLWIALP
jgi:hypothetical protein